MIDDLIKTKKEVIANVLKAEWEKYVGRCLYEAKQKAVMVQLKEDNKVHAKKLKKYKCQFQRQASKNKSTKLQKGNNL